MMIEGTLLEKLRKIEGLHAGTTVAGEREAARRAAERIRARLAEHAHLNELTERVIREAIHADVSEADESAAPKALPSPDSR